MKNIRLNMCEGKNNMSYNIYNKKYAPVNQPLQALPPFPPAVRETEGKRKGSGARLLTVGSGCISFHCIYYSTYSKRQIIHQFTRLHDTVYTFTL